MRSVVFILLLCFSAAASVAAFEVPSLTGPVVDKGEMLAPSTQRQIAAALTRIRESKDGAYIAVLTVPNLDGLTIEQASIQVVDQWKLGTKEKDNGVLLMIAKEERKIRIEVGQGLEGELPDAYASRIIAESMTPLFEAGKIDEGILVGVFQIARKANPHLDVRPFFSGGSRDWPADQGESHWIFSLIPVLVILLLLFAGRSTRGAILIGILLGAMGGGGGGGGSGRSFRGGGGFSGGGASGSW